MDEQPEQVGSVAEEAMKLFSAFSEWAQHLRTDSGEGESGMHPSTCTWCPVCRAVDLVRQASPEVGSQVAEAASTLLQVAAGWLANLGTAADQDGPGAGAGGGRDEPPTQEPPS